MQQYIEHRATPRRAFRLDAVADYFPRLSTGRWWENFEVRVADVGAGGFQIATTVPLEVGARVRILPSAGAADDAEPQVFAGEIVWVTEPRITWLGFYRAGVAIAPVGGRATVSMLIESEVVSVA
jgi:hypothetical protein